MNKELEDRPSVGGGSRFDGLSLTKMANVTISIADLEMDKDGKKIIERVKNRSYTGSTKYDNAKGHNVPFVVSNLIYHIRDTAIKTRTEKRRNELIMKEFRIIKLIKKMEWDSNLNVRRMTLTHLQKTNEWNTTATRSIYLIEEMRKFTRHEKM